MSSYQSETPDSAEEDLFKQDRARDIKKTYSKLLQKRIIPEMFMTADIFAAIDTALGINRRQILVEVLKETISMLESSTIGGDDEQ